MTFWRLMAILMLSVFTPLAFSASSPPGQENEDIKVLELPAPRKTPVERKDSATVNSSAIVNDDVIFSVLNRLIGNPYKDLIRLVLGYDALQASGSMETLMELVNTYYANEIIDDKIPLEVLSYMTNAYSGAGFYETGSWVSPEPFPPLVSQSRLTSADLYERDRLQFPFTPGRPARPPQPYPTGRSKKTDGWGVYYASTSSQQPSHQGNKPHAYSPPVPRRGSGGFYRPVPGHISSNFGFRPSFGRMHKGIDIALKTGDPVKSALAGVVNFVGYDPDGYGYYVCVTHKNGMETRYAHLSKTLVSVGQAVNAGQTLGLGGATGNATGPHLHFETLISGQAINPTTLFAF